MQYLGNPIIRKHGDLVNVVEGAVAVAIERRPEIRYEDLCSLQEANFAPLDFDLVPEAREMLCKQVD